MSRFLGKKVIVRADRAGVFYGTLEEEKGSDVVLSNVRKLWYWDGAAAIEEISQIGTNKPYNCKFTVVVEEMGIANAIQILPCTIKAIEAIEGVEEWKY